MSCTGSIHEETPSSVTLLTTWMDYPGSCLGALTRLLEKKPAAFVDFDLPASNMASPLANAGYVFGFLHSFLVTHAHWGLSRPLAHLFEGLIACTCAWSCGNPRRSLDHVAVSLSAIDPVCPRKLIIFISPCSCGIPSGSRSRFRLCIRSEIGLRLEANAKKLIKCYGWRSMARSG